MENSRTMPPDESRAHALVATAIAFFVLDIVFVALRFWSRRIQRTKFRSDDFLVIATLVVITGECVTSIYSVKRGGVGHHFEYVSKEQRIEWLKSVHIAAPSIYVLSASLPKLAVTCIYLSIFQNRVSRICCWILVFILAVYPIICIPLIAFQCTPVSYAWNKTIPGGHCFNRDYFFSYGALPNIVTDVAILILPMPLIWSLYASIKVKIGLLITFLLGSIGMVASILRFASFFPPVTNGTWATVPRMCWVIVEPSIYLWAACMLAFKPLVRYLVQESGLSRAVNRSWSGASFYRPKDMPYIQESDGGLPCDDGESHNKILREREFCVERSHDRNEVVTIYSVSAARA